MGHKAPDTYLSGARFAGPRPGRPAPHLGAAADEMEKPEIFSRGVTGEKSFCAAKNFGNLKVTMPKFFGPRS
jgi:hypothetical protein